MTSDEYVEATMRTYHGTKPVFLKLRSPELSTSTCLTFVVKFRKFGASQENKPEISLVSGGRNFGEFNLKDNQSVWMNAYFQFEVSKPGPFDFYLKGQNFSVGLDNISLTGGNCSDLPGEYQC